MAHQVVPRAVPRVAGLEDLVVRIVPLVWMALLWYMVVEHGHVWLSAWRGAIESGVVPLRVVLAVHASINLGRRAMGGVGLGGGLLLGGGGVGDKLVEQGIQEESRREVVVRGELGGQRGREGLLHIAVTICHLATTNGEQACEGCGVGREGRA